MGEILCLGEFSFLRSWSSDEQVKKKQGCKDEFSQYSLKIFSIFQTHMATLTWNVMLKQIKFIFGYLRG